MFYIVSGTEREKVFAKVASITQAVQKKYPENGRFVLDDRTFTREAFENFLSGSVLFGAVQKYIVVCQHVLEDKEMADWIVGRAEDIANSQNLFIFSERTIMSEVIKALTGHAEKVFTYDEIVTDKKADRDALFKSFIFPLTDVLADRNRRGAWTLYERALRAGLSAEDIFWQLFRQVKNMCVALSSPDAKTAGMHPFVYSKARQGAVKYGKGRLVRLSSTLLGAYENNRTGKCELELGLELFLLSL